MTEKKVLPFKSPDAPAPEEEIELEDEYNIRDFDYEAYFANGEETGEEFYLRRLGYFCHEIFAGRTPPKWLLENLASRIYWVLMGDDWTNRLPLPWTVPEYDGPLSRVGKRAMRIYNAIKNAVAEDPEANLDDFLQWQSREENVSYSTVRGDYYDMKKWIEKKEKTPARFLKGRNEK